MINEKKILGVIPARGGSKGVPRKNCKYIGGKPLIAWTIEEAKKSRYLDRLILSSEDNEIIELAKSLGCEVPFIRPAELSRDDTPGVDPILHAINELTGYDIIVMLQPTSPLRIVKDIDGCIEKCFKANSNSCVTVTLSDKNPHWMYILSDDGSMRPFVSSDEQIVRRQDLPTVHVLNGAVYVAEVAWLKSSKSFLTDETVAYEMPPERSLDIDTELDLKIVSALLDEFNE